MDRFRLQMLSILGLKKPTDNININDEFASIYMSMLYKEISQTESENFFNPKFRYFIFLVN